MTKGKEDMETEKNRLDVELRKAQLDNGAKSQQLAEEKGKVANLEKELELEHAAQRREGPEEEEKGGTT